MGTILNTFTVILGGTLGTLLGERLPHRVRETVMHGLGLMTLVIGASMAIQTKNVLLVLGSVLVGGLLGEWWGIEERLDGLGKFLEARLSSRATPQQSSFSRGFVVASLVFCVGPMTILGSIQDGLTGDFKLLAVKSTLDGFASLALASTLGAGVALASLTVLVYQGSLTLAARALDPLLSEAMINEMTATGGVLILGIGLLLLEVVRIRVANFLPAIAIAPLLVALLTGLGIRL
ncbi:MAG: DUF554 domain-containing protein [Chloroflexi bacterium]|nr:DUF554 domain-containing protein [Chloroflexota bacterium]